jgi:hypothetical protein
MTQEGYEKLEQELEELKTVKRPEVVEKIKVARSFGLILVLIFHNLPVSLDIVFDFP